jgi:hypothetical protein
VVRLTEQPFGSPGFVLPEAAWPGPNGQRDPLLTGEAPYYSLVWPGDLTEIPRN